VSEGAYATLNLAAHVGDRTDAVAANRLLLREAAHLPAEPLWLEQVHGRHVVRHEGQASAGEADATVTFAADRVCAVMTADCLPVVLADHGGTRIAVAHAGWRGLAGGVLQATLDALGTAPAEVLAWLGPAIGPDAFEVGEEVRATFVRESEEAAGCFRRNDRWQYQADLYALASLALMRAGVRSVHGGGWCTHRESERFFSFRRDGVTGRMATLAWLV
jgi:YfiH family protein